MKVSWPAGKRAIVFDPPVDVAYRKVLEISSKVKSIEVNGREVVIRLDGRLIQDLKVRLK
jgi:6-phosphogluconolactonase (cycloisomerase 2 family)